MDGIRNKKYTHLILPNIDRLYKYDLNKLMEIQREIKRYGIKIIDLSHIGIHQEK